MNLNDIKNFILRLYKYILIAIMMVIISSAKIGEKQFEKYQGGRFGYSGVILKLYKDSIYYYSEWSHTGRSIQDKGKWGKVNYYLNSTSKTR